MTLVVDKVLEDQLAQGVNALVQTVAYNVKLVRGIDSEIKDLTSDIETFSARLIEASKNSWASDHQVLRVVVKKFRNVVNEAQDTIADYVSLKGKHVDNFFSKSLDKIPFCGKINDFASEIQSIRAKLAMIRQDHGQELLHLMKCKINEQNKGLLTLQPSSTFTFSHIPISSNSSAKAYDQGRRVPSVKIQHGICDIASNASVLLSRAIKRYADDIKPCGHETKGPPRGFLFEDRSSVVHIDASSIGTGRNRRLRLTLFPVHRHRNHREREGGGNGEATTKLRRPVQLALLVQVEIKADEAVVIHASFVLSAMISKPLELESMMRVITRLNPCVMVVQEVEANLNSPSFVHRFIDALEDTMRCDDQHRASIEAGSVLDGIRNIVATEGRERVTRSVSLQVRPTIEENNVFGFEKDLAIIKDRFIHAYANFIVIPIVGITGSGKTILASMIFEEQKRHEKFNIWVNVSQGFDRKQKFIDIIYQITNLREDISIMTEEGLAREICELLKEKKYFVVLDDVRKKEDWDSFKVALPTNLEGSRVLVTSPYGNVVDSNWKSHNLGTLSNEEGWLLLENSAFGTEKCNEKSIKNLGKEIANKCNELPLALVAVGGMLRQCRNIADWQRVAENPFLEINGEGQIYRDRVKMTYNDLPNEKLKNCFLYFACFPMGHEIVVWKLIRLWIAEEFIPTIDEQGYALDAEVEAQKYLNDHVDRNLVRVVKQRINGQIKTCCIHNTLHEFCKSEAARINLFHVMDEGQRLDENTSSTPLENISSIRRLCFHSFTENKFDVFVKSYDQKRSLCPFGKHIHSLLLFSSQKGEVYFTEDKLLEIIANTFPLLRVLNIEFSNKLKFQRNELYNLHLLKYLAVKGNLGSLPKSLKNLRGLETLVIETTSRELQIDEGIWNMKKLRHVRTNVSMQLPFPPKRSATDSGGKNIRTLSTVLPKSCTEEIFRKTPNLQKLCVRGDLSEFLNKSKRSVFFKMLKCLENLKLYGKCDKVLMLPRFEQAPRLKRLTFSGTVFKWKDIIILGSLEELEVLKLDDYAFKGEVCDLRSNNIVFKRLQYLRIGRTNLVIWKVAQNNFPALQSLVLRNCSSLKSIPEAFANVHTLEVMELLDMSESAVQSAKEVKEKFTNRGFQLQLDITSKMGKGPMTAGTDTEAVKRLVRYVEWSAGPTGLYSELKDVSLDIEMINARLQDAYKNSIGPVNVFIVKNFQTIVNEAKDVAREYGFLTMKYEDKTLTKFLEPLRYRRNVKSCARLTWMPSGHLHMDGDEDLVLDGDFLSTPASILLLDGNFLSTPVSIHLLGLDHVGKWS
nr:putative late blight resistance protein homolog R1B-8 [Ipomoea batatas]